MTDSAQDEERFDLVSGSATVEPKTKAKRPRVKAEQTEEHQPPNLGQPVPVKTPDFSDPDRPKTCLEVDFPIVPINALSSLEGNAGKPIYQMSKWWARRRSCVFRAMLIAAATEAPLRRHPDGSPVLDDMGHPIPDETEAAKVVWDLYYANHQKAGNFRDLRVLDPFMGGGTTLVEGSRLGFKMAGVDLNPVAWFVVNNELAGTGPEEVKTLFDRIEAEVKPQIQPFYVTECPRGHKGAWLDVRTGKSADVDPASIPPEKRTHYRYEGPEVIYTFWAKHGPCRHPDCGHRTPVFRSPVVAEKKLGVKFVELTCKGCKLTFHAELGDARMAPGAEWIVLDTEAPFTALSPPFALRLLDYAKGGKADKVMRVAELCDMVEDERGLCCPSCGEFAGQWLRDILKMHRGATRVSDIDKKHLRILPERNSTKPVYTYLLIDPEWLKGSPSSVEGRDLGGYADAPPEATNQWYAERIKNLKLIEVRGRIRLTDDPSLATAVVNEPQADEERVEAEAAEVEDGEPIPEDRKEFGLPRFIRLGDGRVIDTRKGTVPAESHFACGACGQKQDLRYAVQARRQTAAVSPYAIQGYCPTCDHEGHIYSGRFFSAPTQTDFNRLNRSEAEWFERRDGDLNGCWPREEIPFTYMTHQANFALPEQGFTHWWKMFNSRQLLVMSLLLKSMTHDNVNRYQCYQALGGLQQYLRNQNMFCIWDIGYDKLAPFFSNSNYAPKTRTVENSVFGTLGRGNWSSTIEGVCEGLEWARHPWEVAPPELRELNGEPRIRLEDAVLPGVDIQCRSSSDLSGTPNESVDLVVTDPPFGDNIFYSDLANFFYVWLRLPLQKDYPELFGPTKTPNAQEALKPRTLPEEEGNEYYRSLLTPCWIEANRVLKPGGILTFTFHHSEDSQWEIVLRSLFDAGFLLEQTFPIASDEMKGDGGQFGAKGTEYDMIHVCRKRLDDPRPVSWPKMRQWVRAELNRLRRLLESYRARNLSDFDIQVILRGKALEFYSRHYGQVFTGEGEPLSIRDALLGIRQLLDEDSGSAEERPPSIVQPVALEFLRLFGGKTALPRDDVGKALRGSMITAREFEVRGWTREEAKVVHRVSIRERFEAMRQRPRREMKTEVDQAMFLIGAAMPGSGVNIELELSKDTWMVRRSVEAVLGWYAKIAPEPETQQAASLAMTLLRQAIVERRTRVTQEQQLLFDDLDEEF